MRSWRSPVAARWQVQAGRAELGGVYSHQAERLDRRGHSLVLQAREHINHPDALTAAWAAFDMALSTLALRVTYGPAFATPASEDRAFAETLAEMIGRSLLR
jgi:hypothetical protein